jgi:alanine racemase
MHSGNLERYRPIPPSAFGTGTIIRIRDLDAVVSNYRVFADLVARTATECAPVLKGDTYGVGSCSVAPLLYKAGARSFFVEDCTEAIALRRCLPMLDARIYVMEGLLPGNEEQMYRSGLTPCVNCIEQLRRWSSYSRKSGASLPVVIHLDSGMNRIGFSSRDVEELTRDFDEIASGCEVVLYMSHLADIKGDDHSASNRQLERLNRMLAALPPRRVSLSCTDGVTLLPNAGYNFDMVRIGVGLIGGSPSAAAYVPGLRPAIEMYVRLSQLRWIEKGDSVGYGGAFTAKRPMRVAVAHIGYKDGYIRSLSSTAARPRGGWMAIGGHLVPIVGLISQGLTTLDVTDVPEEVLVQCPYAEIFGPNVDIRAIADLGGCYEVAASLGRVNARLVDFELDDFVRRYSESVPPDTAAEPRG